MDPATASGSTGRAGTSWLVPRLSTIAVVAAVFISVAGGWYYVFCGEKRTVGLGEEPLWFPHEAAKFAGSPGMPDRFLAFHIGHVSLLEYYNGPKKKGYADARLEVVGPELFRSYLELENEIYPGKTSWEGHLEALGRPSVLVEHDLHAVNGATLLASRHWKCVWFDLVAAVFVHDSYAGAVNDYEVDFATRHFRKDPANEPRGIVDLVALAKAARNYLNFLPPERESLTYPLIWAGLDAALRAIRTAPDTPEAWKYLGQIELSRTRGGSNPGPEFSLSFDPIRDLESARATYALRRAQELMPDDFTTLLGLASTFSNRRMLGEAKKALETLVQLDPINKLQANDIINEREIIEKIRNEMGDPPSLEWRNLSELDQLVSRLIASGRIAELADLLERAYPADRAGWDEVDRVASVRLQLGQPSRARDLWSQAKRPPRPGIRQARIAATHLAEGEFDRARAAYHGAVEAAPDLFEAHYGLAVLEQDAGNADEAHDHALMAMDLAGNSQVRFAAAQGLAGRVSRFLTRPTKVPAL
jgi:tetratricopeptide (TPR) repeat protein